MKHLASLLVLLLALLGAGCAYVDPAKPNPGRQIDYTRAESIAATRRLSGRLFAHPGFQERYRNKRAEKSADRLPAVQVAFFESDDVNVRVPVDDFLRLDLREALADSGWFTLSGDIDACDYVLHGTYRSYPEPDGSRVSHRVTLELKDTRTAEVVWTASDEISKR